MIDIVATVWTIGFAYAFVASGDWSMLLFGLAMGYQLSRK